MRYEKYTISKLFKSQNGDTDIKKSDITGTGVPVITSGVDKYGIMGETDIEARIIKENTITIDMFGNAFFRPFKYKMVTHARVFSMELIGREMNEEIGLFLVSHFHWLPQVYNYSNMCSFNKIKDSTITLPTLDELDENSPYSDEGYIPDWEYMEKRVAELEELRVAELAAYLEETGLSDYILTDEDMEILSLTSSTTNKEFREFELKDIFQTNPFGDGLQVPTGSSMSSGALEAGSTPRISVKSVNNGIIGYYKDVDSKNYRTYENCISVSFLGTVFYHPYKASFDMKVHCLKPINRELGRCEALYLVACIKKLVANNTYGNQTSSTDLPYMKINLPVTDDKKPDWDYMEKYIRAIEKIVIADVVKYKDEIIATTKKVVG